MQGDGDGHADIIDDHGIECDFEASRNVREYLIQNVYPVLHSFKHSLPMKCPLRQEKDSLYELEKNQIPLTTQKWACGLCLKQFETHKDIDRHMTINHAPDVPEHSKICLADYSGIILPKNDGNNGDFTKLKFSCYMLVDACFGSSSSSSSSSQSVLKSLSRRFRSAWCERFDNDHSSHPISVTSIDSDDPANVAMWSQFRLVMGIMVVIILFLFYVGYFVLAGNSPRDILSSSSSRSRITPRTGFSDYSIDGTGGSSSLDMSANSNSKLNERMRMRRKWFSFPFSDVFFRKEKLKGY